MRGKIPLSLLVAFQELPCEIRTVLAVGRIEHLAVDIHLQFRVGDICNDSGQWFQNGRGNIGSQPFEVHSDITGSPLDRICH